jgi:hypothetical protein
LSCTLGAPAAGSRRQRASSYSGGSAPWPRRNAHLPTFPSRGAADGGGADRREDARMSVAQAVAGRAVRVRRMDTGRPLEAFPLYRSPRGHEGSGSRARNTNSAPTQSPRARHDIGKYR